MFDVGFSELLVIAIISLIVMGPERLPETVRTIGLWIGRLKQMFINARKELEDEVGMDEVRRQLHNEKILSELESNKSEFEQTIKQGKTNLEKTATDLKQTIDGATDSKS
jgi:sec-independent protein translocase protein TatB